MRWLAVLLVLAACSSPPPEPPPIPSLPAPPEELASCPGPAPVPVAPKPPRSVERIAAYAVRLDESLVQSEAARRECARRLARLHEWIAGER